VVKNQSFTINPPDMATE